MSLQPLFDAPLIIQFHAFSAIAAFVLGGLILWRNKGTRLHRLLGRLWVLLMVMVALSALFIHETRLIGPFSPIHLLVPLTLIGLGRAIWHIRVRRDVQAHQATMKALYLGALLLAGTFTFLPGRLMHKVLFGVHSGPLPAVIFMAIALALTGLAWWRMRRTA